MEPRKWQVDFLHNYLAALKRDYLLVATPGAGKTSASLYAAKQKLQQREIEQVIVVCPTESLKYQWAASATRFGIQLFPRYENNLIKRDYHGICLTYSKVLHSHRMLDHICGYKPTMVILDEIHHSGDKKSWGEATKKAFHSARRILGLSGTPFRGDDNQIPFVEYLNGEAQAQFIYGYGDAIKDNVCRKVMFPSLDGGAEFYHHGEIRQIDSFTETGNEEEDSQLLRAILEDVEGEYLTGMLKDADDRLNEIREYDPDAGGLIVAMRKNHADEIAIRLKSLTGEYPVVVHSDNENALADIETFANSRQKWIVAVRMVSEGVDIKRLRVGVYATNVLQELTFRQIVGRVVRRVNDLDDWAYFYVPLHQRLVKFMKRIKDEITHVIDLEKEKRTYTYTGLGSPEDQPEVSILVSLGTERNPDEDLVISENEAYNFNYAVTWRDRVQEIVGVKINEWQGAKIIELWEQTASPTEEPPAKQEEVETKEPIHVREKRLRQQCNKVAYAVACRLEANTNTHKKPQEIVTIIHYEWSQRTGNSKQSRAGIDELERKLEWLNSGTIENNPGRYI
jgi:superfamily II DNA or RNA helicase